MTVVLAFYRMATAGLSPLVPQLLNARAAMGKEISERRSERLARHLQPPPGGELIWLHGASVGETKLLVNLAKAIQKRRPEAFFLFTSQTRTSAELMEDLPLARALHQFAPIDTPSATKRFIAHWQPDLCIFAEGEIWPNLLRAAQVSEAKLALVNARMTPKSISNWTRWKRTARNLFSQFDVILAADRNTAHGLSEITGRNISPYGSLKCGAHNALQTDHSEKRQFDWAGPILLGASTHAGEEEFLIDSLPLLPDDTRLILAPRHPERGDELTAFLAQRRLLFARWSKGDWPTRQTKVLLADTMGEMPTWFSMSDHIYLGGAHLSGIGGHNPLEPLSYGKQIMTGPHASNFADIIEDLQAIDAVDIVRTTDDVAASFAKPLMPNKNALEDYFSAGRQRLNDAAETLDKLLPPSGIK
ncbi:MAG: glycosyltransferase N-terminal domain-containing protein [Pseudomonadota bacterium]